MELTLREEDELREGDHRKQQSSSRSDGDKLNSKEGRGGGGVEVAESCRAVRVTLEPRSQGSETVTPCGQLGRLSPGKGI